MRSFRRNCQYISFGFAAVILTGCASARKQSPADYLAAPAKLRLTIPVYVIVQDDRSQVERQGDPAGSYRYTTDRPDTNAIAKHFGRNICEDLQQKGITARAAAFLPGETTPADGMLVRVSLESWYGRLPANTLASQKVLAAISPGSQFADGRCRFHATITQAGVTEEVGTFSGKSSLPIRRDATVEKEGNYVTALAGDQAIAEFLQAFERQARNPFSEVTIPENAPK